MAKRAYDVHPGVEMMQMWVAKLKLSTGRSLNDWVSHIRKSGPRDEAARRERLKAEHGLGTNTASWLAERAREDWDPSMCEDDPEGYLRAAAGYVEGQYAGKKAGLRPVFDEVVKLGRSMGKDVKVCPCKTIVPLYRQHVFAQIKPTTNSRIDLGFALAKHKGRLPKRLIDTGGKEKKDRITHRIELTEMGQIDAEVKRWLRVAYELDA